MGQYAHGNQPIQHMLYLYNYAGQPWKAQMHIRDAMNKLYTPAPDGLCAMKTTGKHRHGMFLCLGMYPVASATGHMFWVLRFSKKLRWHLENGKPLQLMRRK